MVNDAFPSIGALPIGTLETTHLLAVLRAVAARGAASVALLGRGYLGQVFRYAVATRKARHDPVPSLRGALAKPRREHHPTLTLAELGPFLAAIASTGANRSTVIAVRLLLLTMTRTIELRRGAWAEMDLGRAEWRLPPERMKMRAPHIVPLPRQAVELLRELAPITGHLKPGWLFPNMRRPSDAMGSSTIGAVFIRAGYAGKFSPHGFRGTAATILREAGYDSRLVELQLAHADRDASRASYDHAELLGPRRAMLQAWADMIDAALVSPRVLR
jgi:integrase